MDWHHANNHISNSDQLRTYRQGMHELSIIRAMTLKGIIMWLGGFKKMVSRIFDFPQVLLCLCTMSGKSDGSMKS